MKNRHFTIVHVETFAPATLRLTYADGEQLQVDLHDVIARHPTLARLANPAVFAQAAIGQWGGSIVWADEDDLELAADNLRARAIEQAGGYSHELIWNWMAKHRLSLDAAAEALGLSRRMLAYYRSGEKPIPRTVALALLGWEVEQHQAA
ncbi:DUF2442 domain-containing protein [Pseudomonas sp. PA15(2017)]|uniref:DUF2442 domain-containing protein n=1 Tax=Pseudomonas sp. PA15(2017) TaxID=1932111 RepID=UPI000A8C6CF6|nr:DUF2442 domain-containing protein [Pseudomonas sp. PA15(2017)]